MPSKGALNPVVIPGKLFFASGPGGVFLCVREITFLLASGIGLQWCQ